MSNVSVVSAPGSKVVHLALLWNAAPICGRRPGTEWDEVEWQGRDETRELCSYCRRIHDQLNTRARMYPFQGGVG